MRLRWQRKRLAARISLRRRPRDRLQLRRGEGDDDILGGYGADRVGGGKGADVQTFLTEMPSTWFAMAASYGATLKTA